MSEIRFYEIVRVHNTARTADLGISGTTGIVVGIAEDEHARQFAVLVGDETHMVESADVTGTGEIVDRQSIYDGEVIRVLPERYA